MLSLSVVIVLVKIFSKFHDDDTINSQYDDKTTILLFLRAFKLFSQQFWLFYCLSTYQMKLFSFVPGRLSIVVAPSLWTTIMTVIVMVHEIFKTHCPFLITCKLGQMLQIPLGTHPGMICIEKFHTKMVSILSFLMFEKCRFRENYL